MHAVLLLIQLGCPLAFGLSQIMAGDQRGRQRKFVPATADVRACMFTAYGVFRTKLDFNDIKGGKSKVSTPY